MLEFALPDPWRVACTDTAWLFCLCILVEVLEALMKIRYWQIVSKNDVMTGFEKVLRMPCNQKSVIERRKFMGLLVSTAESFHSRFFFHGFTFRCYVPYGSNYTCTRSEY